MHEQLERRPLMTAFPPEPFRASAEPSRSWHRASLVQRAGGWWLIHPEVAATYHVPDMLKVDLHDCVCRGGLRFVLAVFESEVEGLQAVLNEAVILAREQWVRVRASDDWSSIDMVIDDAGLPRLPPWPPGGFMDELRRLFQGRCISTEFELQTLFHDPGPDPVLDIHRAQFPTPTKLIRAARPRTIFR